MKKINILICLLYLTFTVFAQEQSVKPIHFSSLSDSKYHLFDIIDKEKMNAWGYQSFEANFMSGSITFFKQAEKEDSSALLINFILASTSIEKKEMLESMNKMIADDNGVIIEHFPYTVLYKKRNEEPANNLFMKEFFYFTDSEILAIITSGSEDFSVEHFVKSFNDIVKFGK